VLTPSKIVRLAAAASGSFTEKPASARVEESEVATMLTDQVPRLSVPSIEMGISGKVKVKV
jgi:hypothetical protein